MSFYSFNLQKSAHKISNPRDLNLLLKGVVLFRNRLYVCNFIFTLNMRILRLFRTAVRAFVRCPVRKTFQVHIHFKPSLTKIRNVVQFKFRAWWIRPPPVRRSPCTRFEFRLVSIFHLYRPSLTTRAPKDVSIITYWILWTLLYWVKVKLIVACFTYIGFQLKNGKDSE